LYLTIKYIIIDITANISKNGPDDMKIDKIVCIVELPSVTLLTLLKIIISIIAIAKIKIEYPAIYELREVIPCVKNPTIKDTKPATINPL
jgi:hypothetical protein